MRFWRKIFTTPNPISSLMHTLFPGFTRDLGFDLRLLPWNRTSQTAIAIQTLNHPVACEMGSSSFAAMSQLKVVIMTSASLTIIPPTKREMEKIFSVGRSKPTHVCTSWFSPKPTTTYPL